MMRKKIFAKRKLENVINAINTLSPYALSAEEKYGFQAEVLIAQACLETGWLKHILKARNPTTGEIILSHNLFNIKRGKKWNGEVLCKKVVEFKKGKKILVRACFRKYNNYGESFEDYCKLIKSVRRYRKAYKKRYDPYEYIKELHKASYATDPFYSDKIIKIMDKYIGVKIIEEKKKEKKKKIGFARRLAEKFLFWKRNKIVKV